MEMNQVSPTEMTDKEVDVEQPQLRTMPQLMGNSFRKFLLLIWKNTYLIRKRHWVVTIYEILVPLLLFVLMAVLRASTGAFGTEYISEPTTFPEVSESQLSEEFLPGTTLNYAPKNQFTMQMLARTAKKCGFHDSVVRGFSSEAAVIDYFNALTLNESYAQHNFMGVIFEGEAARPDVQVPQHLSYKMRLSTSFRFTTDLLFETIQLPGPDEYRDTYLRSGFTALQVFLDKSYTEILKAKTSGESVTDLQDKVLTQKMPYPPYTQDAGYSTIARYMLPSIAVFSFITLCIAVVKRVVEEKETGVRELMRLMGMEGWALWGSWLVDALLVRLFSLALVVWLLKADFSDAGAVLRKSDGSVLYMLLLAYTVPAVISCFAVSSFFSRPTLAMSVSIVLWIASQSLPSYYAENMALTIHSKRAMLLLPNMGLYYMFTIITDLEARDIGAQWSNLWESGSGAPDDLSLSDVLVMFALDCLVFTLITWYVSSVSPGQFGVAQPWYFPIKKDFWMPCSKRQADSFHYWECDSADTQNFERPLSQSRNEAGIGVFIRGLTKTYAGLLGSQPVPAVQGLSLDLYKGEVTALLGHNGAGKTTTMSILTGMIGASGGSVTILGHDLGTELSAVRSSLGLCPQHNMLFKDLTVREHLIFFAMLKGNSYKASEREAKELVEQVHLKEKWEQLASTLSGGMKRKLSLAIALIGGSKVLMLDEPTSGLDPEARREIWNLLQGMRGQRTILLSTHFMEEADVLGDTIAIMAHGKVHCCGSSLYLKRLYGAGYHLTLMRKQGCDVSCVTDEVRSVVREAELVGTRGDQTDSCGPPTGPLTFRLPSDSTSKFPQLLDRLENARDKLGITNLSMSVTTMEEVFLKVGELTEMKNVEDEASLDMPDSTVANEPNASSVQALHLEKNSGWRLWLQQMSALVVKKWLFTQRRWLQLIFHAVIPLALMLVTISVSTATITPDNRSESSRLVTLKDYGPPSQLRVLYSANADVEAQQVAQSYADILKGTASLSQVPSENDGLSAALLDEGSVSLTRYRKNYVAAGNFLKQEGNLSVTAVFSSNALHASPISVNLVTNALLRHRTSSNHSITTTNHPLPSESPYQHLHHQKNAVMAVAIVWLVLAPLGWLFVGAATIVLPLQERICGSRQLQVMAGCSHLMVWLSYLIVDVAINTVLAVLTICIVPFLDTNATFSQGAELGTLFLLLFLYGMSGSAFAYTMSFAKNSAAGAYALLVIINMLVGIIVNIIVYVLQLPGLGDSDYKNAATALRAIFGLLLPHSALASALSHFGSTATYNAQCRNMLPSVKQFVCTQGGSVLEFMGTNAIACCEDLCGAFNACLKPVPYLSWSGSADSDIVQYGPVGREVLFLALGVPLWLGVALLMDCGAVARIKEQLLSWLEGRMRPRDDTDSVQLDEDVNCERNRVSGCLQDCSAANSTVLAVQELAKDFGVPIFHSRFSAVRGVSFAVAPGECFGLLGVNGAGKTTTFRMLTGVEAPTQGNARLQGSQLRTDRRAYLRDLGYCPQFDAQLGVLTGKETLALYGNLRGLQRDKINSEILRWLSMLGLLEYGSRPTSSYSGGNRRKLSAAMALIGEPPLVLLDEPTSGVDPIARRLLWHVLERCQQAGQAIVLTSHSMDECEALCSRLGIMVAGQLVCLGATTHLKHKFGQGFTLMVKVRSTSWSSQPAGWSTLGTALRKLKSDVEERLGPCELKDEHQGLLHYHITDPSKRWSELFSVMEELKIAHGILEDYTLSETTLEQVFLSFARTNATVPIAPTSS